MPIIVKNVTAFHYNEDGFSITDSETAINVKWADIEMINVYKRDLLTTDCVMMEISYQNRVLTIHEELFGWGDFVLKLEDAFPSIPKDWFTRVAYPAFETNFSTIYNRNGNL